MALENDEVELTTLEINNLVVKWLKKQSAWNLQDAIYLLVRKDPDAKKNKGNRISFSEKNENEVETRALTHVLKSFADPNSSLISVAPKPSTASPGESVAAIDYSVEKRNFIKWAEDDWDDDAGHLTMAIKEYKNVTKYKKPHKTTLKTRPRREAHENAFEELLSIHQSQVARANYDLAKFKKALKPMVEGKGQKLYGPSELYKYLKDFKAK